MVFICGPKCSWCCAILSAWGIIQLALMGVFYQIRTPILAEDVHVDEEEWAHRNFSYSYIVEQYEKTAVNCWIASGIYVACFILSVVMIFVNKKTHQH